MRTLLRELKNCRISFPDHEDLQREEQNRKIRAMYTGKNYRELAVRFDLSYSQIWAIVNEDNP